VDWFVEMIFCLVFDEIDFIHQLNSLE